MAQNLARQVLDLALRDTPEDPQAVVTSVQQGAATDGLALVTVNYRGATLHLRYMTHYTPVVGHIVTLRPSGGDWYIAGRLGGFPPTGGN